MSRPTLKKSKRQDLLKRLSDLGRKISTQTVFLHQAIAQTAGLNATDAKCIDLILSAPNGSVTAGWLSDSTGLTTGAITHILDRLEKLRFVDRVRDSMDRRKVFVRVRLESLEPLIPKYEEVGRVFMSLAEQYNDKELLLICDYMEKSAQAAERELARMVDSHRSLRKQNNSAPAEIKPGK